MSKRTGTTNVSIRECLCAILMIMVVVAPMKAISPQAAFATDATPFPAAQSSPVADPDLVPASACGDDWLDWWRERDVIVRAEIDTAIKADGDQAGNRVGPVLRQQTDDLRKSDPPAALVGVMIIDAWLTDTIAEAWEAVAKGELSTYDAATDERFYEYQSRVFEAFTQICETGYRSRNWTFADGETAPMPTPVPERSSPVRRADVCSGEWVVEFIRRSQRIATEVQNVRGDPQRAVMFLQAAQEERSIDPPAAGVALSVLFTFYYDEMAGYWSNPLGPYPQIDDDNAVQYHADAKLLADAYQAICGDVEVPTT